ncbi:MAG: tail fiber protein [Acidovorax sp.]|nr:tail fiber protein [Acidovorax sp.]
MLFAGNFCPIYWLEANGATLPIHQNSALFSILGTTYGGDGVTTFKLPDLRGRSPIGDGQGLGLTYQYLGTAGGAENVTLSQNNMPAHTHAQSIDATTAAATHSAPGGGRMLAQAQNAGIYAASNGSTTSVASGSTGASGGNAPLAIRNPYLAMRWCICTQGIFPSRP